MIEVIDNRPIIKIEAEQKRKYFLCKCSCGNILEVRQDRINLNKSCGCENHLYNGPRSHLMSYSKEYKAWLSMKDRCLNPNNPSYANYGGIGVKVQNSWIESFEEFFYHIGVSPNKNYSVDRIDSKGDYEEGNVRWATISQQARNKRKRSDNTSGKTGVRKVTRENGDICYIASCRKVDGKSWSKTFSEKVYGENAFRLACEYRDLMIDSLNTEGAGYTEDHGK